MEKLQIHYDGSKSLLAVNIVMSVLAVAAVALRLLARKGQVLKPDDWLIIVALVLTVGICMAGVAATVQGVIGPSIALMTPERYRSFRLELFVDVLVCHLIYGIIKLSMLFLYRRIFSTRAFQHAANILIGVTIAWMITIFIANLTVSKPLNNFWDVPMTDPYPYVYDYNDFLMVNGALDVVLDLMIVSMPLPMIRKLHTSTKRKVSVGAIFMLGFFCLVSSIVRLYYIIEVTYTSPLTTSPDQITYDDTSLDIWAHIEACASVFTACLPTLGPLFRDGSALEPLLHSTRSLTARLRLISLKGKSSNQDTYSLPSESGISQSYEMTTPVMDQVVIDNHDQKLHAEYV